jgi:hypothetical protein
MPSSALAIQCIDFLTSLQVINKKNCVIEIIVYRYIEWSYRYIVCSGSGDQTWTIFYIKHHYEIEALTMKYCHLEHQFSYS